MKQLFLIYLLIVSTATFTFAQTPQPPLTPARIKSIEKEAKDYIKEFAYWVPKLASTENKEEQDIYIKNVKKLFKADAKIEVINLDNKKRKYSVDSYLENVVTKYSSRFELVVMRFESMSIDPNSLVAVTNDKGETIRYKGSYHFSQIWCVSDKKKEGKYDMSDFSVCEKTVKKGEYFLEKKFFPSVGERWVLFLGDIKCEHITDLKN